MAFKLCGVEGCDLRYYCRGYCKRHYSKWYKHGDPLAGGRRYATPEEKFADATERQGECLVWVERTDLERHASIWVDGKAVGAHRYAWEREHGPIPDGTLVDHACHNPRCVEVKHLRLATSAENGQNRSGATARNKLGVRNVYRIPSGFAASVRKDGVRHYKSFPTLEEASAHAARLRAELFGEFAGGA